MHPRGRGASGRPHRPLSRGATETLCTAEAAPARCKPTRVPTRRLLAGALLGLVVALGACQGDNLFVSPDSPYKNGDFGVQILQPVGTVPLNAPVLVKAVVASPAGIKSVEFSGIALRGDSLTNVTQVDRYDKATATYPRAPATTLPTLDTIARQLTPVDTSSISEPVYFIVTMTDSAGAMVADTLLTLLGGPHVTITLPVNNDTLLAGDSLRIAVAAVDSSQGIDSVRIGLSGVMSQVFKFNGLGHVTNVTVDTTLVTPPTAGDVTVNATVWSDTFPGIAVPRTVHLVTNSSGDGSPPRAAITITRPVMTPAPRLELDDTLSVLVTARDVGTAGIARTGIVARLMNVGTASVVPVARAVTYASRSGTVLDTFNIELNDFGLTDKDLPLPAGVKLVVSAFARDAQGNCGGAVHDTLETYGCIADVDSVTFDVPNTVIPQRDIVPVIGMTVLLPAGGTIADAVVDTLRQRLFLSNIDMNRIDVLSLSDMSFRVGGIRIGSRPWGLFIGGFDPVADTARSDTLIVANSGGTNISYVGLAQSDPNALAEDTQKRLLTPNVLLWGAQETTDQAGAPVFLVDAPIQFSDRPQFVAQDSLGRIVYSTVPTTAAPDGTIRLADSDPDPTVTGDSVEVVIFTRYAPVTSSAGHVAIERADSIKSAGRNSLGRPVLAIYDHKTGFPGQTGVAVVDPYDLSAVASMNSTNGWDVVVHLDATWNLEYLALHDTTFIAASGDRGEIAIGEGAVSPFGRIMIYRAIDRGISDAVATSDLIGNVSERVNGLALNRDGALGAARGASGAYYFTGQQDGPGQLRLQGLFQGNLGANGAGAALHPDHTGVIAATGANYSFIGTDQQTIKIIDTVYFVQVGEVSIRDNIVGPLRATRALPSDNVGLTPTDPNWVMAKLYGVTSAGGVVVLNIRNKDIQ